MKTQQIIPTLFLWAFSTLPSTAAVLTEFSEATLNPQVFLDIPDPGLASVTLDTANGELDFITTGNTDMWTNRNNAPIAWTNRPTVGPGDSWFAETHVRFNGNGEGAQRVAGLTLWPGPDGTGGSNDGMEFSLGLNDWDNRGIEFQGFGNGNVGDSGTGSIVATANNELSAHLRLEVTENGVSDSYLGFYKINANDPWMQFASFNSSVDNSRVGLFFKNGNGTAAEHRSVSFDYFNVAVPEPSISALLALGCLALLARRRR